MDTSGSRAGCFDSHKDDRGTDSNPRLLLEPCHVGVESKGQETQYSQQPSTINSIHKSIRGYHQGHLYYKKKVQEVYPKQKTGIQENRPLVALHTNVFGSLHY